MRNMQWNICCLHCLFGSLHTHTILITYRKTGFKFYSFFFFWCFWSCISKCTVHWLHCVGATTTKVIKGIETHTDKHYTARFSLAAGRTNGWRKRNKEERNQRWNNESCDSLNSFLFVSSNRAVAVAVAVVTEQSYRAFESIVTSKIFILFTYIHHALCLSNKKNYTLIEWVSVFESNK